MSARTMVNGGGREVRLIPAQLQLSDVETTLDYKMMRGLACPYGDVATRWFFRERLRGGLFEKNLKESGPTRPLLLFHDDQTWPIGSSLEWDSVDDDGLWGTWRLDDAAEAQRAARMAKEGHLKGLSIGYMPILSSWEHSGAEEWDPNDISTLDIVERVEARLGEVSLVPVPLWERAGVTMVATSERTARPCRASGARTELERWQRWRASIS